MLLILIYRVFFFPVYFPHLSLLPNIDEMGHSGTSIYVTMFVMVMFILKVSIFLRVRIKSYSLFMQEKEKCKENCFSQEVV